MTGRKAPVQACRKTAPRCAGTRAEGVLNGGSPPSPEEITAYIIFMERFSAVIKLLGAPVLGVYLQTYEAKRCSDCSGLTARRLKVAGSNKAVAVLSRPPR